VAAVVRKALLDDPDKGDSQVLEEERYMSELRKKKRSKEEVKEAPKPRYRKRNENILHSFERKGIPYVTLLLVELEFLRSYKVPDLFDHL